MNIVELRKEWVPFFEMLKDDDNFMNFLENPTKDNASNITCDNSFSEVHPRITWTSAGMTRLVLGTDEGVVFKLPFFEENKEYDYCRMEVRNYRAAEEADLGNFFAECDRLCWLRVGNNFYPIYVMKYVEVDSDENLDTMSSWYERNTEVPDDEDSDEYQSYEKTYDEVSSGSSYGVGIFLSGILGSDIYKKFEDFCFKNDITDIHSENFGFDGHGHPVIIDYAGYGDWIFEDLPTDWYSKYGL